MLAEGTVVCVTIPGGFDEPRQLMGDQALCLAFYDQPELVEDMLATMGETTCAALDRVASRLGVDQLFVHEDLAGRSGPLIGPAQFERFVRPYYRRCWDLAASRGVRLFKLDTDGNVNPLLPAFLEAGVNLILPFEPAAGMDVVDVRRRFGSRLAIIGGLDKFALRKGPEAVAAELEYKIPPLARTGGVVFGLDHRVPDGTPLETYRFYVNKVWEILERETGR